MGTLFDKTCDCFSLKKPILPSGTKLSIDKFKNRSKTINTFSTIPSKENPQLISEKNVFSLDNSKYKKNGKNLSIEDFILEKEIGKGGFGKVLKVRKNGDKKNRFYAMKILKKTDIIENSLLESTILEKNILQKNKHPFIVTLNYSFQTPTKIYLVMEYLSGGDLFHLLRKHSKFSEDAALFYLAEVILALDYLHKEMNLIYRDLKPENILIHADGHIKITDFGLSKQTDVKTFTFAGTPEYLAPEIIEDRGQTKSIDWWGCGILLFEMMAGIPPFINKEKNFDKIRKLILDNNPRFPVYFSEEAINIIKKFLVKDPTKRLGTRSVNDIKKDPFFKKIDWERLIQKRIDPPFVGLGANEKMAKRSDKIVESYEGKTLPYMDKMTYNPDVIDTLASHKESLIKKDSMNEKRK